MTAAQRALVGCDFSSRPTPRKPIVLAHGGLRGDVLLLHRLQPLDSLEAFAAWVAEPGRWLGAFDTPLGLPRELVQTLRWPEDWADCMRHYCGLSREQIRASFKDFCDGRPAGSKFAHRTTDLPAGSSPSMKWVNPPVAYMMHAAVDIFLGAGVDLPGLHAGDPARVVLEGYPGLLARELIGRRSYKSDDPARQTGERLIARRELVHLLELGVPRLGLRLRLSHAQRDALAEDARGDQLDAVLCLMLAGWAARQGPPRWGLPEGADPLEGWIIGA